MMVAVQMTDRNPSVLCISLNYEDQTYDVVECAKRAFRVLEMFKDHVNWTHLFVPPVLQGTAWQRTMQSREATRIAGHAGPAPSAAPVADGAAAAGAAADGAGGAAAGAAAAVGAAAVPAELDWFAWIEDERQRGLAGRPPGLLRTAPAGVYSLRSIVCHVGNHYVAFEHAASLKIEGGLSEGCWKLYNDDVPVVALPNFAAVRSVCMDGRWTPGDKATTAIMALLGMRTPAVIDFGMPLVSPMARARLAAAANEPAPRALSLTSARRVPLRSPAGAPHDAVRVAGPARDAQRMRGGGSPPRRRRGGTRSANSSRRGKRRSERRWRPARRIGNAGSVARWRRQ